MPDATSEPASDDAASRLTEIRERAATEASRHTRFIRSARDGRVLSAIMRPFYAFGTPPGHGILVTTGRRSGRPRPMCIRTIRRGDTAYLVMLRPPDVARETPGVVTAWVQNIRADPRVRLTLGRRTFAGVAREIDDQAELARAREILGEAVHLVDYGECEIHLRGWPTRTKIRDLHRYWFDTGVPIAVDLAT